MGGSNLQFLATTVVPMEPGPGAQLLMREGPGSPWVGFGSFQVPSATGKPLPHGTTKRVSNVEGTRNSRNRKSHISVLF